MIDEYNYKPLKIVESNKQPIISLFDSDEEAVNRLNCAGLSSIPVWFRSYESISAGEQFRANIALNIRSKRVIDEYTSNLDRLTARSLSTSLRKYIDKNKLKKIVLAGCCYDVIPWLRPDLVFDVNTRSFLTSYNIIPMWKCFIRESELSYNIDKKKIILCKTTKDKWDLYAQHHYLTSSLLNNSVCS